MNSQAALLVSQQYGIALQAPQSLHPLEPSEEYIIFKPWESPILVKPMNQVIACLYWITEREICSFLPKITHTSDGNILSLKYHLSLTAEIIRNSNSNKPTHKIIHRAMVSCLASAQTELLHIHTNYMNMQIFWCFYLFNHGIPGGFLDL